MNLFFGDHDGDGHGVNDNSDVIAQCSATPPPGFVASSDDCCDSDANAHPGLPVPQLAADYPGLTTDALGNIIQVADKCGSFDWDCSGDEVPRYTNLCTTPDFACDTACNFSQVSACTVCLPLQSTIPETCTTFDANTPASNVYSNANPPCGSLTGIASLFCQGNSSTTCSGLGASGDPVSIAQLCFWDSSSVMVGVLWSTSGAAPPCLTSSGPGG
jgi:hypothetical protein